MSTTMNETRPLTQGTDGTRLTTSLREAIDPEGRLAAAVETAIIPGRLRAWALGVTETLAEPSILAETTLEEARRRIRGLTREDAELSGRQQCLAVRYDDWLTAFVRWRGSLRVLRDMLTESTDSGEPVDEARQMRHEIAFWLVEGRCLMSEIDTWSLEALYRDRGVAD